MENPKVSRNFTRTQLQRHEENEQEEWEEEEVWSVSRSEMRSINEF